MSFALADRVKETSASTGTGAMTLLGPESACQSFVGGIGASVQTYYCIAHRTANEWEVGIGTISASPDSLSRDTVLASSNSGAAVDFSAGTKDVFCTHNAERTAYFDHNNRLIVSHTSGDTLWISHDGTANLFETNAGSFKFTADASLADATIVVDINGVGTGNGKLRIWDEDTEYLEAYCDNGNGFIEVKSDGGTPNRLYLQYSGNADIRSFYGTNGNPSFVIYGYDSGASAIKAMLLLVGSDGTSIFASTAGEDIALRPGSSSADQLLVDANGDVWAAGDIDVGGEIELASTDASLTQGVITQNGNRVFHTYEAPGTNGSNTFIGKNCGTTGLTGSSDDQSSYNVGVGYNVLNDLLTGRNNVAIGTSAGTAVTTGNSNMLLGFASGLKINTGSYNAGLGYYSLLNATSANYNVGIGKDACRSLTTAVYDVGIGAHALYAATGSYNTGIGSNAGRSITTGAGNTFIGYAAGYDGTNQAVDANYSIAIGYGADTGGDKAIAIGYGVSAPANEVVIGDASITKTTLRGELTGWDQLHGLERSADPTAPAEGEYVIWMSDGTGKGDDGDILVAATAGGTTRWGTLFDHSAGNSW